MQKAPNHYDWIKILWTIFGQGHPRNIHGKLFQNRTSGFIEEDFLRISLYPYSARRPHSTEPCLSKDQNFSNIFWKGSPTEHSCEIISKSDKWFRKRGFFKNFSMSEDFLRISLCPYHAKSPHSPELCLWTDKNFTNTFWKGSQQEHSCEIISKLDPESGEDF